MRKITCLAILALLLSYFSGCVLYMSSDGSIGNPGNQNAKAATDGQQSSTESAASIETAINSEPKASVPQASETASDPLVGFHDSIRNKDRNAFCEWADSVSIAQINDAVASLDSDQRTSLCSILLDSSATGSNRKLLLKLMNIIISVRDLGFYAGIFSYTAINFEGDGFFYTTGHVSLTPGGFLSLDEDTQRHTLTHECFHSFNDMNGGPDGALDEGSAIWISKKVFHCASSAEDWAEATYGTKSYYKVFMANPDYPLEAPETFSPKLIEVYTWLSDGDQSCLPWWDDALLKEMYAEYYEPINRDCDFTGEWLPAVENAREQMLKDPLMTSADRIPMPAL
jgi:hypothetical protein